MRKTYPNLYIKVAVCS